MLKVRTFLDQDEARYNVSQICTRFAYDALCLIDAATGPDGPDNLEEHPPELTAEYAAFRAWLGPELISMAQSLVVGPLLGGLSIDEEGRVRIESGRYADRRSPEMPDRLAGRLRWLADEIPSLINAYGELYEDELNPAFSDVEEALELDLDKAEDKGKASIVLGKLERWYLFCHPGARLLRNDDDAIKAALEAIEMSRKHLEEEGITRDAIKATIEGRMTDRHAAPEITVGAIEQRLKEIEGTINTIEKRVCDLDDEREALLRRLSEIENGNAA